MTKYFLIIITVFLVVSCNKKNTNNTNKNHLYKNIDTLYKKSLNSLLSDSLRLKYLTEAVESTSKIGNDSLKAKCYIKIAYSNLILGNLDSYGVMSKKVLRVSTLTNDTIIQARAYSDLGYYYQFKYMPDSAFYSYNKAYKIYTKLHNKVLKGRMLLSMATIQADEKDYLGSEINTIKALSILNNSNDYRVIYLCNNTLGFIELQLKKYDEALKYRIEAYKYLSKVKEKGNLEIISINSIGMVYQKKGEYKKAIPYFEKALEIPNISKQYPKEYAMLIDNLAYTKFKLGITKELPKPFFKALKIRDSLQFIDGIQISDLHLAEYYSKKKDTLKAISYLMDAKKLAKKSKNNINLLDSYLKLSKLQAFKKGINYLQKYIKLSDSLQENERLTREKFTRIAYETDEIYKEKEVESKKKWWLAGILVVVTSFSSLVFMNMKQRSKNKELLFNKKQDDANTEIYNLMLAQQSLFQEGSNKEKNRISEELHDGILGRLFGTRLNLDSLNEGKTVKEIKEREAYIEELQIIEEDIRKISHNLKTSVFNANTSFIKLVEQLLAKQSKISNFEWKLNFNNLEDWENISNNIKINCYRILQESIQNINKYAKATKVEVEFYKKEGNLGLTIKDNGLGYNSKIKNNGIGQKNILSRVKSLNGKVKFISSVGSGTEVIVNIPM